MAFEGINMIIAQLFISVCSTEHTGLDAYQPVLMLFIVILDLKNFEDPQVFVFRVVVHNIFISYKAI
jgi:hypothetical protein